MSPDRSTRDLIGRRCSGLRLPCELATILGVRQRGADEVSIRFANNFVSGPSRLAAAFEFIRDRSAPFKVATLPGGRTERDKIDLIARLVAEGLLSCSADGKERNEHVSEQ